MDGTIGQSRSTLSTQRRLETVVMYTSCSYIVGLFCLILFCFSHPIAAQPCTVSVGDKHYLALQAMRNQLYYQGMGHFVSEMKNDNTEFTPSDIDCMQDPADTNFNVYPQKVLYLKKHLCPACVLDDSEKASQESYTEICDAEGWQLIPEMCKEMRDTLTLLTSVSERSERIESGETDFFEDAAQCDARTKELRRTCTMDCFQSRVMWTCASGDEKGRRFSAQSIGVITDDSNILYGYCNPQCECRPRNMPAWCKVAVIK